MRHALGSKVVQRGWSALMQRDEGGSLGGGKPTQSTERLAKCIRYAC